MTISPSGKELVVSHPTTLREVVKIAEVVSENDASSSTTVVDLLKKAKDIRDIDQKSILLKAKD